MTDRSHEDRLRPDRILRQSLGVVQFLHSSGQLGGIPLVHIVGHLQVGGLELECFQRCLERSLSRLELPFPLPALKQPGPQS